MECRDAQFYLRLKRHHATGGDELGADVTASLDGHLATCRACAADARAAASFDRAMASAMCAVPVPAGLRDQLIAHVASKQGAILRRRLYRGAVAAAAAVVLVFLGLGVFSTTRPQFPISTLAERDGEQANDPDDSTREWLASQKLPDRLPRPFDYNLLVYKGIERVEHSDVPVIVFRSSDPRDPRGFAKVYIVRQDGRFDLKGLQDAHKSHAIGTVIVGEGERFRGVTYVIIHTGGPDGLNQFLTTRHGGMISI